MKRKLLFIAAIVICLSLTAYGTLAYFTAEDTAHNVITTGDVDIILNDEIKGGTKTDNGWSISGVMPSQQVKKIVSVKNTGEGAAWIRVKLTVSIVSADGKEQLPTELDLPGDNRVIGYHLDSKSWQEIDGYIYYKQPVPKDGTTASLFMDDNVWFAKEMGNEYQGCTVTIQVDAEAVQSANNGATYREAKGWPKSST